MLPGETLLSQDMVDAEKTGKSYPVGNEEFLRVVFGDPREKLPIVVSFEGSPTKATGNAWIGKPWRGAPETAVRWSDSANNYFSLAVFSPDSSGAFRRQKAHFQALFAVMLDDLGTKADLERLTLPPSWILETSSGNCQAGYLLRDPITDGGLADRLMNAISAAGLSDPGANGPQARLARLPVGSNGKHTPPFPCRLTAWLPDFRYTVEELVAGLGLDLTANNRRARRETRTTRRSPGEVEAVWIPRAEENSVLAALHSLGMYKETLGPGKHDISCPWVLEHTGEVDHGTAYFEPDDERPLGGFSCRHGHCEKRDIRDLLGHLNVDESATRYKPTIRVVAGRMQQVVDAAEQALAGTGRYFQRGGVIVSVLTDPGTGEVRVHHINGAVIPLALSNAATWEKFDGRSGGWVLTDPPERHARVLSCASSYRHLPALNGIARQPYLRLDGSLGATEGFDRSSGMFGAFRARDFTVPDTPTRAEAENALGTIRDLVSEFGFVGLVDRAAAISAILTAAVRASLTNAPMFHVRAHMAGSGKSYLCELITAFATAQRGAPTAYPSDEEECRKLLIAELLRAPAVIEFDNLTSDLVPHKSLCSALTSKHISGRILGVSQIANVGTCALFLSSGNNVGPTRDMTRRCITIHLDPGCELPASRVFRRPQLVQDVLKQRERYVSAALTIIRAWITAGRPKSDSRALVGYEEWGDLCRHSLIWLGLPDPAASVFVAMADDPDRELLSRLLACWPSTFSGRPTMVRDLVRASEIGSGSADLREVLQDITGELGEINRRRLGWWLKQHAGQIVDGKRLVRARGHRSAEAWRVQSVSPDLSVSSSPIAESVRSFPALSV